jgi:hypothetical protein
MAESAVYTFCRRRQARALRSVIPFFASGNPPSPLKFNNLALVVLLQSENDRLGQWRGLARCSPKGAVAATFCPRLGLLLVDRQRVARDTWRASVRPAHLAKGLHVIRTTPTGRLGHHPGLHPFTWGASANGDPTSTGILRTAFCRVPVGRISLRLGVPRPALTLRASPRRTEIFSPRRTLFFIEAPP